MQKEHKNNGVTSTYSSIFFIVVIDCFIVPTQCGAVILVSRWTALATSVNIVVKAAVNDEFPNYLAGG